MPYAVYTTGTQDGRCPIRTSRHVSPDQCVGVCMLCGCVCCATCAAVCVRAAHHTESLAQEARTRGGWESHTPMDALEPRSGVLRDGCSTWAGLGPPPPQQSRCKLPTLAAVLASAHRRNVLPLWRVQSCDFHAWADVSSANFVLHSVFSPYEGLQTSTRLITPAGSARIVEHRDALGAHEVPSP